MRAGALKHNITILRPFENRVIGGSGSGRQYETFATVYASIQPLTGKDRLKEAHINHEVTHEITIRYIPGILPTFRLQYQDVVFRIEYIINKDFKNQELIIRCKEEVARG